MTTARWKTGFLIRNQFDIKTTSNVHVLFQKNTKSGTPKHRASGAPKHRESGTPKDRESGTVFLSTGRIKRKTMNSKSPRGTSPYDGDGYKLEKFAGRVEEATQGRCQQSVYQKLFTVWYCVAQEMITQIPLYRCNLSVLIAVW